MVRRQKSISGIEIWGKKRIRKYAQMESFLPFDFPMIGHIDNQNIDNINTKRGIEMFNKKILLSVLIIGMVGVMAGSATWAYFQDTEISEDNTLTAGTLDLTLTNAPFTLNNKQPGDFGTETQTIQNVGSLIGELDVTFSAIANTESEGTTQYESDNIGGTGVGELGGVAEMLVFIDVDSSSGTLTEGDIILTSDGTGTVVPAPETPVENTYFATINSYASDHFDKP